MKTMTTVALLLVVIAGAALADQPTDAKLEAARKALNSERYREAAALYSEVYEMTAEQAVAGDALYWQAFARYRLQQTQELQQALKLLQLQRARLRPGRHRRRGRGPGRPHLGRAGRPRRGRADQDMRDVRGGSAAQTDVAALHAF